MYPVFSVNIFALILTCDTHVRRYHPTGIKADLFLAMIKLWKLKLYFFPPLEEQPPPKMQSLASPCLYSLRCVLSICNGWVNWPRAVMLFVYFLLLNFHCVSGHFPFGLFIKRYCTQSFRNQQSARSHGAACAHVSSWSHTANGVVH